MYYNLLPEDVKKDLRNEYRLRLLSVSLLALAVLGFIASASFVPALVVLLGKEKQSAVERQALEKIKEVRASEVASQEIAATREKVEVLAESPATYPPSDLIARVLAEKPTGISVTSIVYDSKEGGHTLVVNGTASTRNTLTSFRDRLEKVDPFTNVHLPVGVLAKNTDVAFSLTIEGTF